MIKHSETKSLKYSSDQMFALVANIEDYPKFIPWCRSVRITSRTSHEKIGCDELVADMNVSFKIYQESFSSRVTLCPFKKNITVEYINGPFKFLSNKWFFTESCTGCTVNFNVEFEFKSRIIERVIGVVFQDAMRRVVLSFEQRADMLFGK